MHGEDDSHDEWQSCPAGELSRLAKRLNVRERRVRLWQLASTGLLSMFLFAAGAILIGGFVIYEEPTFGGISCTDCLSHSDEYHAHLVGKLPMADAELAASIETHLKLCGCCRTKFHHAYPDVALEQLMAVGIRFRAPLPTFAMVLSPMAY